MADPDLDDPYPPGPVGARLRRHFPTPAPFASETSPLRPMRLKDDEKSQIDEIVNSVFAEYGTPLSKDDPILCLVPIVKRVVEMMRGEMQRNLEQVRMQVGDQASHLITRTSDIISSEIERQAKDQKTAIDTGIAIANEIINNTGKQTEQQMAVFFSTLRTTLRDALKPVIEQKAQIERIEKAARKIVISTAIFTVAVIAAIVTFAGMHIPF